GGRRKGKCHCQFRSPAEVAIAPKQRAINRSVGYTLLHSGRLGSARQRTSFAGRRRERIGRSEPPERNWPPQFSQERLSPSATAQSTSAWQKGSDSPRR